MRLSVALPDAEATHAAGLALGAALPYDAIVLLEGDLGAGKTTLARGLCEGLGVRPALVTSPTYTLANIYPAPRSVYHVDLYRLETPLALLDLDEDDWLNTDGVTLIEWPGLARPLLQGRSLLTLHLDWPGEAGDGQEGRMLSAVGDPTHYGAAFKALEGV